MLEFSQLLELLYNAHRDVHAMFVETRDWGRQEATDTVTLQPDADGRMRLRWMGAGPFDQQVRSGRRVWFVPPDRVRVEVLQGNVIKRTVVRDGEAWWRWDCDDGESAGDLTQGGAIPPLLDVPLLNPARLLSSMWFEVRSDCTRAGRAAIATTAVPRYESNGNERRFECEFDVEHGTLLHMVTHEAGERISATEVLRADYDPEITDKTFTFATVQSGDSGGALIVSPQRPRGMAQASNSSQGFSLPVPQAVLASHRTVWLTGLPGAGKSSIARATERLLQQLGARCCVLDGDEIRLGLSSDLGLTREDRGEQARRVAHIAAMLADAGVVPVVALVSPYAADRELARTIHEVAGVGFLEVWVDTPLDVCVARDPNGIYAAASNVDLSDGGAVTADGSGVTGLTAPYETPAHPDIRVGGDKGHPRVAASQIVELMLSRPMHSQVLSLGDPAAVAPAPFSVEGA